LLFRRSVVVAPAMRSATLRISADARYVLYVNGTYVHTGPARSFPARQAYDTLDLAPFLVPGENVLAVVVAQYGVSTFFSVYRGVSGLWAEGAIETTAGAIDLSTPGEWVSRPSAAWKQSTARWTFQMAFQEHIDADGDPADWMKPAATLDDAWKKPEVVGVVGGHPYLEMEDRGVPLLANELEPFAKVLGTYSGENARGWKISDDVYALFRQEEPKRDASAITDPDHLLSEHGESAIVPPRDGFAMAVLEAPGYRTAHLVVEVADAAGDEIIDLVVAEDLVKGQLPMLHEQYATAARFRCRPGSQRFETFGYYGLRYVAVVFRNVEKPLKVSRIAIRSVTADLPAVGEFACSDETLTRIWTLGRNTQRNCTFDAFVDCPWREQAMWWGDAHVQARVTQHLFGDASLLARGIRLVAQSQQSDGAVHAHPPADVTFHYLPDFMLTWIGSIVDHHLATGDCGLAKQAAPAVQKLLAFFRRRERDDGLIGGFDGWWVFLDWAELHKSDFSAVLNLQYARGLRAAARVFELAGLSADAADATARANRLLATLDTLLWDEKQRCWRDGIDPASGAAIDKVSQHANALAILLGLRPDQHAHVAAEWLLKPARARRTKVVTASPFFYAYVLEALVQVGLRSEAVALIREKWGAFVELGADTLHELWPSDRKNSRCHAWSASPVYHLMQNVLGVVSLEPGWRKVRIQPVLCDLDFARGAVPTPHGRIEIDWEKAGDDQLAVRIVLPPDVSAEFVDPLGARRTLEPGAHQFHT
jgi:hypothetical protein